MIKRAILVIVALLGMAMSGSAQTKADFLNSLRETAANVSKNLPKNMGKDGFGGQVIWMEFSVDETARSGPEIVLGYKYGGLDWEGFPWDELEFRRDLRKVLSEDLSPISAEMKKYNVGCRVWYQNQFGRNVGTFVYTASEIFTERK